MAERRKAGAPAVAQPKRGIMRVLTAAAGLVNVDMRGRTTGKPPKERWQPDAWDMLDLIPEVGQAIVFMANVVSGVRVFVAQRPDDPEGEPIPVEDNTPGAAEAKALLERLRAGSPHGGLGGLLYHSVVNLKTAGDGWLVGQEARDADLTANPPVKFRAEWWDVRSIDEIEVKDGGTVVIKDSPSDKGTEFPIAGNEKTDPNTDNPDAVFLLRVYDRHPRYKGLARSSLRAALNECDELLLLGRCVRAAARRFLAGNGLLAVPEELDLPGGPDEGDDADPESSRLMTELAKAMVESMADEGNADSLVPLMLMGPGELMDKLQHLKFGGAFDAEVRELRDAVIKRLGSGLDLPIEQLTGIAQVNHWGAWQIDGASWARYGQPTTRLIVESWAQGLLWPYLEAAMVDPVAARNLLFWFDPADAIMDPDESKTADEGFDRGAISWEAYRRRKGFGDDEAPDDAELDRRSQLGLLRGSGMRTDPNAPGPPNDGEAPQSPDGNGARLRDLNAAIAAEEFVRGHRNGNGHRSMVAAPRRRDPLGRRLMQIDRNLRARLEEAAEATLRRALERAGARVQTQAKRTPNLKAAIAGVPNDQVFRHVTMAFIAEVAGLTTDDLLAGGVDDLQSRFDARVRQAQRQVRTELAAEFDLEDDELATIEQHQDQDRQAAWLWLSGTLLALARDRIHDPAPAAPAVGEFDASSTVPTGIIREAMARAGGGDNGTDQPNGGVATGNLVMDLWAQHGRVVSGWEWVYGDSSSRTQPFPAHEDLDGEQFSHWSDDLLIVQPEDGWLGVTHYRPGDHPGCQCDFAPVSLEDDVPSADDREAAGLEAVG